MSKVEISFFQKEASVCPICSAQFYIEKVFTGRGRIIAANMRNDLRRNYKYSEKYGLINLLIYNPLACRNCLYASLPQDFFGVSEKIKSNIASQKQKRIDFWEENFGEVPDFSKPRNLYSGMCAYILSNLCYALFSNEAAPTIKRAICSIRATWLCEDISQSKESTEFFAGSKDVDWEKIAWLLRILSFQIYQKAYEKIQTTQEYVDRVKSFGPDLDTNYGYDGFVYQFCYLGFEMIDLVEGEEQRHSKLFEYRTLLAKLFGIGKVSKSKPSPLLEKSRYLHSLISVDLLKMESINHLLKK